MPETELHQQKDVNRYTKVKKGKNNTREKKRFKILQVSNYTSLSKTIDKINQELLIHFIYCRQLGIEILYIVNSLEMQFHIL